jgi:hypothetical protein
MARSPDPFDDLDDEDNDEEGGDEFDVDDFGTGEGKDFGIPDAGDDEDDDGIDDGGDDDGFDFRDDDDDDFDDFDLDSFGQDDDDDDDDDEGGLSRPLIGLIAASLVFIVLIASLVGWLMISFDPEEQEKAQAAAQVVTALAPPPGAKAGAKSKPQPKKPAKASPGTKPKPEAGSAAGSKPATAEAPAKTAANGAKPTAITAIGRKSKASTSSTSKPVIKKTIKEEKVVVAAVDPELIDETTSGPLPKIAPDGRQAWQVYARPFTAPDKKIGKIAVVLAGLGLSKTQTLAAIQQLPGAVTLSFAPYARNLGDWIAQSRAAGHEVLLELPMEPYDYPDNDPGPHTLLTTLSTPDNIDRLNWLLGRFPGYVGVTNYMGAKFMTNETKLLPIIQNLKERGLLYLDAKADRKSVAARVAKELKVPIAANNRFIDREASRVSIDARLYELERISKSVGSAVGIAFPYPVSVERLSAWIATLQKKGIVLAPITAIANTQPIR